VKNHLKISSLSQISLKNSWQTTHPTSN